MRRLLPAPLIAAAPAAAQWRPDGFIRRFRSSPAMAGRAKVFARRRPVLVPRYHPFTRSHTAITSREPSTT